MKLSPKQLKALSFWSDKEVAKRYDLLICDGAVRSGKTFALSLSFVLFAMENYDRQSFAFCGKTSAGCKRNVVLPLLTSIRGLYKVKSCFSKGYFELIGRGKRNTFYIFGGKDEGSAALIQGMTLAGVLLDEAVLMPESFFEQAIARCSVEGAKVFVSCNPSYPGHWLKREWIDKRREKKALYLHFTMKDNPSLSKKVVDRYESLFAGAFYRRYILGEWAAAEGLVYPMFSESRHVTIPPGEQADEYGVSIDYGTRNPLSMGLWGRYGKLWYRIKESYYDGQKNGFKTDEEYYRLLKELVGALPVRRVVIDPSALSMITCIKRHGEFAVRSANNRVTEGIHLVSEALMEGRIFFSPDCKDTLREFSLYCWEDGAKGDRVKKENDHAMDDIRYFTATVISKRPEVGF